LGESSSMTHAPLLPRSCCTALVWWLWWIVTLHKRVRDTTSSSIMRAISCQLCIKNCTLLLLISLLCGSGNTCALLVLLLVKRSCRRGALCDACIQAWCYSAVIVRTSIYIGPHFFPHFEADYELTIELCQ